MTLANEITRRIGNGNYCWGHVVGSSHRGPLGDLPLARTRPQCVNSTELRLSIDAYCIAVCVHSAARAISVCNVMVAQSGVSSRAILPSAQTGGNEATVERDIEPSRHSFACALAVRKDFFAEFA
uniref:Uncharacterized protein n=1 Tax=Ascaris lumbricoides TaxID=6252 RepID=A0A0M3HTS7_ASCLU